MAAWVPDSQKKTLLNLIEQEADVDLVREMLAFAAAVGVNTDGQREVLGVATGPSEAEIFWKGFLRSLADWGLRGVKSVVADDHKGLRAAAAKVFAATHQRCRVPWFRNALAHVGPKNGLP